MIVINPPSITEEPHHVIISCQFSIDEKKDTLWYKVPEIYRSFIITGNLDAFVVGLLFKALEGGHDIHVRGAISSRLNYTLGHYVINALCFVFPEFKKIRIFSEVLKDEDLNTGNTAGTALSCGVDSLATYFDHILERGKHKVEFFTFFNVGSHGDYGGERARKIYHERLKSVKDFAAIENKQVISVDSNLSEILKMKFQSTYTLRIVSCVLLFQKLFRNYYYATGTRFDHYSMNRNELADLDMLLLPNLSTESTTFYPAAIQYTRIERTALLSEHPITYDFLDVCVSLSPGKKFLNCSTCYKCMRTQLTLEILGKLNYYDKVFNIKLYKESKNRYLGWLLSKRKKLTLDTEFIKFMKGSNFKIPFGAYVYQLRFMLYRLRTGKY